METSLMGRIALDKETKKILGEIVFIIRDFNCPNVREPDIAFGILDDDGAITMRYYWEIRIASKY